MKSATYNRNIDAGKVLYESNMNPKILGMWSRRGHGMDFYKTGFETLLFNQPPGFALDTVLHSVLKWDDRLLVAGCTHTLESFEKRHSNYRFSSLLCEINPSNLSALRYHLEAFQGITHLLYNISTPGDINPDEIPRLLEAIKANKLTLIVNCLSDVDCLNDLFRDSIDFMIGGYDYGLQGSFVVARRSKLVQTEGNSRSFDFDLYSYWQLSLRSRDSIIEPMCG